MNVIFGNPHLSLCNRLPGLLFVPTICVVLLTGCAAVQKTPVPGLSKEAAREEVFNEIRESDVLAALKCQMTRGFLTVDQLKSGTSYGKNPSAKRFVFKSGSGTLSGKMSFLVSNGATIKVIFPFSGFDGTNASPSYARKNSSTTASEVKTTFNVEPKVDAADLGLCRSLEADGVEVGDFVTNAIIGAFTSAMDVPLSAAGKPYGPQLTSSIVEVSTSFTVVRNDAGGFTLKIVPSAPRVDEGDTGLTRIVDRSDVYVVTTKLPTLVGEKSDTRRLHYCMSGVSGKRLCIEEPFTSERYTVLTSWLSSQGQVVPPLLPGINSLSPMWFSGTGQNQQPAVDFYQLFPTQPEGADF